MPRLALAILMVIGSLAVPTVAVAGTVTLPNAFSGPFVAVLHAGEGEVNDVDVREVPFEFFSLAMTDTGAPLTGQGPVDYGNGLVAECSPIADGVKCFPATNAEVYLGDMNDRARVVIPSGPGIVWAGSGDDRVSMDSFGRYTIAYGEEGDDELSAGGEGGQLVDGGAGNDLLHVGGWIGQATGLGGPGDDRLIFRVSVAGTGHVEGGTGEDRISLQAGAPTEAFGGNGADVIDVPGRRPQLPQDGGHTLSGGNGSDTLSGGPNADTVDGGRGADSIDVAEGGEDTVSCGQGLDTVRADASDSVASDCEVRLSAD